MWYNKSPLGRPIDSQTAQAQDLAVLYLFNEGGGGKGYDAVRGSGDPNGPHGTFPAGPPVWGPGKFGSGLKFSGGADEINLGTPAILDLTATNWSIIAWINPDATQPQFFPAIYMDGVWRLSFGFDTGAMPQKLEVWIDNANFYNSNTGVPAGVWSQVGLTWDGSNLNFFLNGMPDGSSAAAAYTNPATKYIGGGSGAQMEYAGFIDHECIYRRELNQNEMMEAFRNPFGMMWEPTLNYLYVPSVEAKAAQMQAWSFDFPRVR